MPPERIGPVDDGEADDGCVVGSCQRHPQKSHISGDADGFCSAGAQLPGEPVPVPAARFSFRFNLLLSEVLHFPPSPIVGIKASQWGPCLGTCIRPSSVGFPVPTSWSAASSTSSYLGLYLACR